jgi:hypothetical protein
MRVLSLASLGILLGISRAVDTNDPFCESTCTSCCNVNNDTEFEYLNIVSLTYPDVSLTGKYTILDPGTHDVNGTTYEGTVYQEVVRYENDANLVFDRNVRIFTVDSQVNISCSDSHFYFDGQKFNLEKVEAGTFDYCRIAGINGVLNRTKLDDYTTTSGVYFGFYKLVEERTDYKIMFDSDNRIIPVDDIFDYQYFINTTTLTVDSLQNEYYLHIDVLVSDINDMPVDGSCADLDTVMNMSNGYVYIDGTQKCELEYFELPAGDENAGGRLFRYKLPQSRYEECAESFTNDGQNIVFSTTLYTPTFESLADECYYFQPGFSEQALTITIDADISTNITQQFEQFSLELTDVDVERCTPIEDYIIPQGVIVFTMKATFVGDTNEIDWLYSSLPYVSGSTGETNYLYGYGEAYGPETGNGEWKNCTELLTDGSGNTYRECTFKMKTGQCEKLYVTDTGQCGFERNNTRYIYNLEFREEYSGGLFITHRTPRLDTNLEYMLFPEASCSAPDEREPINVNDEFPTNLIVRNYYQNVDVNWTNATEINFNDRITLRLSVGEEAGTVLSDLSVMLKTVLVTLRDPTSNVVLTQYSFNVAEKKDFMDISWSLYNDDPIFCSWYDATDSGGDYCQPFYDLALGRDPSPWTQNEVDHVCKRNSQDALESNSRNVDYWAFDPKTWFVDLYSRPYLKVSFTVNAVIYSCGTSGGDLPAGDRRLGSRDLQSNPSNTVRYVSDELIVIFGQGPDGEDQTEIIKPESSSKATSSNMLNIIIGASVGGGVAIILLLTVIVSKRRHASGYQIQNNVGSGKGPYY